jgi:hypothetical protein
VRAGCLVFGQWKVRFFKYLKIPMNRSLVMAERLLNQPVSDAILAPNPQTGFQEQFSWLHLP